MDNKPYFIKTAVPVTPEPRMNPEPWEQTSVVGKSMPRVDAYERVSGTAIYPSDVFLPDMLYAAIVRCPFAHAKVKSVDTTAAAKMPGVRAVLTADDPAADIPWFSTEETGPVSKLFDPHCRYAGEEVAAVAADTPQQAWDAVRAITVNYEELPFVTDTAAALESGSVAIHGQSNVVMPPSKYERGNVDSAFAQSGAVVEMTFRTSCEIHTPMEIHGSVAKWDGGHLTVWDSTQGVFAIQQGLAQVLKLPMSHVRVIGHYMGGGFGSKLELGKYTVIAALFARKTARPVKLFLTREESYLCVGNRPSTTIVMKAGATKDGQLTALQLTNVAAAGAYPGGTWVGSQAADLYLCPNVRVEETQVYINAGVERAFRAPGFPQGSWALEQILDELSQKIGMDPVEFRLKNIPSISQRQDKPYTSTGLRDCLVKGAESFEWKKARSHTGADGHIRKGAGVAAAQWGYAGGPPSTAIVKLFPDGSANLNIGISDIGTGSKTVMVMVVAEELGIPVGKIEIEHADTGTTPFATPSGGSKTVPADAPAVRAAAMEVKKRLLEMASSQLHMPASDLTVINGAVAPAAAPDKKVSFADLEEFKLQQVIVGIGYRAPNPAAKVAKPFAAQFAEVEVNTRTGEVRILRLTGAHDSGRVMNLLTYRNQVFGGMTMGIGFALTERRILDANTGKMVNANWHDYKIPTAMDVPNECECVPVDPHDTEYNSVGAKGLGEPATIPTAAAIANAVFDAIGVRVTETPITPARILQLLAAKERG